MNFGDRRCRNTRRLMQSAFELGFAHLRPTWDVLTLRLLIKFGAGLFVPLGPIFLGCTASSRALVRCKFSRFFFLLSYFDAPASRSPMAIACLGFLTLRPRLVSSSPCLNSCMTRPMVSFCAFD